MNGLSLVVMFGALGLTAVLAWVVDVGDRRAEADAVEFRRRLAQIPDGGPEAGHGIPAPHSSAQPGGGAVPGGRSTRPCTCACAGTDDLGARIP